MTASDPSQPSGPPEMPSVRCPRCGRALSSAGEVATYCMHCGARLTPESDPDATKQLDPNLSATALLPASGGVRSRIGAQPPSLPGYRFHRLLGEGGMGAVFEAEQVASGRQVAIKIIAEADVGAAAVARFRREGQLASTLAHPRCVFVIAADEHGGLPYIVMEKMPGATLKDLIAHEGPLPPSVAVQKVLDVIDGLRAAHALGIIHRDVKPSNCFLEHGGRVKVGDFGLSKMLAGEADLTRSGSFLGTVAFASPEQVRRDPLDIRTDVYSTCATLYYLLAGRPPFDDEDAAAVVARIVSEPAPSLRRNRPALPTRLDRVVLKGLERDRERRWKDLDALRRALLPFVPAQASLADLRRRSLAMMIDIGVLILAEAAILAGVEAEAGLWHLDFADPSWYVLDAGFGLFYFGVCDCAAGATIGKRLLGLRIYGPETGQPPGLRRGLVRTALFCAAVVAPGLGLGLTRGIEPGMGRDALMLALPFVGAALLFVAARRRNGFRGLHEWGSGTRTVGLPPRRGLRRGWRMRATRSGISPVPRAGPITGEIPGTIGPYEVRGPLRWGEFPRVLLAFDPNLNRSVWVVLRVPDSPPIPEARRELARPTRLRWLTSASEGRWVWDAYLAPRGRPLSATAGTDAWPEARGLLEQLADELAEAERDATTPDRLDVDQVWLRDDGGVELVDWSLKPDKSKPPGPAGWLVAATRTALDGAPVPVHADALLDRLARRPDAPPAAILKELELTQSMPTELGTLQRLVSVCLFLGTMFMFLNALGLGVATGVADLGIGLALLTMPLVWETITRGGWGLLFVGVVRVAARNRRVARWRALLRGLVVWGPIAALFATWWALQAEGPLMRRGLVITIPAWALVCALPGFSRSGRMLQDRAAGTYLVPE